jgi:hypothetical protein
MAATPVAATGLLSEFEHCDFLKNKTASIRKNFYEDLKSSVLIHCYHGRSVTDVSEHSAPSALNVGVHFQFYHEDRGSKIIYNIS